MTRTSFHQFSHENRTAEVWKTSEGFEVDLMENGKLLECRQLYSHSESFAEDCADNWCQGMFNVAKEGSFYGYNQKTDNYYKDLD
jgi:hypothetical protein|tara:strand:+ start:2035 stop:2289 length:255 start_codon:yes stop_codon:yes gene_type:complete